LEFKNDLQKLVEKKYFVSPNFSGSNCLLVFTKIKDKYYQFLIDRKTLSYNSKKINYSFVKLIHVNVKLDINIYKDRGTIFDGVLIQNNGKQIFIITDTYMFKGQDLSDSFIDTKLTSVSTYFKTVYNHNDKNNDIKILVNELFEIHETDKLINKIIPDTKDFLIKGICFYPEQSSTKLIYMFDNKAKTSQPQIQQKNTNDNYNRQNNTVHPNFNNQRQNSSDNHNNREKKYNKHDDTQNSSESREKQYNCQDNNAEQNKNVKLDSQIIISSVKKIEKSTYLPKTGKTDLDYIFEMKKTDMIDVYNLNIVEPTIKEGKTLLKRVKIGLAYVSGLERSKWCQRVIEENNGSVLVNCKFHDEKQKWEPISVADEAKKPSLSTEFIVV
jgi:hypothetical protein